MFKSSYKAPRIAVVVVMVIAAIIGYYFVASYVKDQSTLRQVNKALNWVEDFYTTHSRYPSRVEFTSKFPTFKSKTGGNGYSPGNLTKDPAQSFTLSYDLTRLRLNAPGQPIMDVFGYSGSYSVEQCQRWSGLGLSQPYVSIYTYPPSGLIRSDFSTGSVYFTDSRQPDVEIPLLNGLDKPRILRDESSNTVVITNGNDVVSYDWDGSTPKLSNPQKIGTVPTSCPASSP